MINKFFHTTYARGGGTPTYPVMDQIFLACDFNNNLNDEINSNHGSWVGTSSYTQTGPGNSWCMDLSTGTDVRYAVFDYASQFSVFNTGAWSVSFWFWNDLAGTGASYQWRAMLGYGWADTFSENGWGFFRSGSDEKAYFATYDSQNFLQNHSWADKTWEHVILTCNRSSGLMNVYWNNSAGGNATKTMTAYTNNKIRIFNNEAGDSSNQFVYAKFAALRCYGKILTSGEMTSLYNEFA